MKQKKTLKHKTTTSIKEIVKVPEKLPAKSIEKLLNVPLRLK